MCRCPRDSVSIDNPNKTYILYAPAIPKHRLESVRRALLDNVTALLDEHQAEFQGDIDRPPILTEEQYQDLLDLVNHAANNTCGRCGATGLVHGIH